MHRAAGKARAVFQGLALHVESGEGGKQGRVDVHDALGEGVDEDRGKQPHETGQHHQLHAGFTQSRDHGGVEGFARGKLAMVDDTGGDPGLAGAFQGEGVGLVAGDQHDLGVDPPGEALVDEGLEIGAAAAGQHAHAQFCQGRSLPVAQASSTSPASSSDLMISPMTKAFSLRPESRTMISSVSWAGTIRTMPMP